MGPKSFKVQKYPVCFTPMLKLGKQKPQKRENLHLNICNFGKITYLTETSEASYYLHCGLWSLSPISSTVVTFGNNHFTASMERKNDLSD